MAGNYGNTFFVDGVEYYITRNPYTNGPMIARVDQKDIPNRKEICRKFLRQYGWTDEMFTSKITNDLERQINKIINPDSKLPEYAGERLSKKSKKSKGPKKIKSYNGDGNYIFVSYSHDDKVTVYPVIEKLQTKYNVWFDEGLEYGRDFYRSIITKINNCSVFLYFVSLNSLKSSFCERELRYAANKGVLIIPVVIEDVLKRDEADLFMFEYSSYQMCHLYKMDLDEFLVELERKAPRLNEALHNNQ